MDTRDRYTFICRQFRIADNAEKRACDEIYGGRIVPRIYTPMVQFAVLGLYAVSYPEAYAAACKTRLEARRIDDLPASDGKYRFMMWEKKNRNYLRDIPF